MLFRSIMAQATSSSKKTGKQPAKPVAKDDNHSDSDSARAEPPKATSSSKKAGKRPAKPVAKDDDHSGSDSAHDEHNKAGSDDESGVSDRDRTFHPDPAEESSSDSETPLAASSRDPAPKKAAKSSGRKTRAIYTRRRPRRTERGVIHWVLDEERPILEKQFELYDACFGNNERRQDVVDQTYNLLSELEENHGTPLPHDAHSVSGHIYSRAAPTLTCIHRKFESGSTTGGRSRSA